MSCIDQDPVAGKVAIREMFLGRTARHQQVVEIKGIELWGDLVICRAERRETTFVQAGGEKQIRILLVKGGQIEQVIVVLDPDAYAHMRGGASAAAQALDAFGGRDQLNVGRSAPTLQRAIDRASTYTPSRNA
ncbi:MAG: hypothetical protein NVSMB2_01500 [Chloroflexota bacterium]